MNNDSNNNVPRVSCHKAVNSEAVAAQVISLPTRYFRPYRRGESLVSLNVNTVIEGLS